MSSPPVPAGLSVSVTGEVMVAVITAIFILFVFAFILFLRMNRFLGAHAALDYPRTSFPFAAAAAEPRRGLDPTVLKSLPATVFSSGDLNDGAECAICLSELAVSEVFRRLPGCRHGFHLDCIDMWFSSHSTCPICRSSVKPAAAASSKNALFGTLQQSLPIKHWALPPLDGEGSSSSTGSGSRKPGRIAAIEVPRIESESSDFALQGSGTDAVEEVNLPVLGRLRSLRRMLTSERSPSEWDIEQGAAEATGKGSLSSEN